MKQQNDISSVAKVWDQAADSYDSHRHDDAVYASCTRQATSAIPSGIPLVLDAGCGTGIPTAQLSRRSHQVVAVDYSYASLAQLKAKRMPNVLLVQADLRALPFADATFGASVCANALQHVGAGKPQARVIAELKRTTRMSGILVASVHHYSKTKRRAGWNKEGNPGQPPFDYIFRFSREELAALMPGAKIKAAGFYDVWRIPFFGGRIQNIIARLFGQILARLDYGHMLIASVRNTKPSKASMTQQSAGAWHSQAPASLRE
jgi:SAM-dependent methyltransferase